MMCSRCADAEKQKDENKTITLACRVRPDRGAKMQYDTISFLIILFLLGRVKMRRYDKQEITFPRSPNETSTDL